MEFQISGCVFKKEKKEKKEEIEVTLEEINDAFIDLCESKGWEFCGITVPLKEI